MAARKLILVGPEPHGGAGSALLSAYGGECDAETDPQYDGQRHYQVADYAPYDRQLGNLCWESDRRQRDDHREHDCEYG